MIDQVCLIVDEGFFYGFIESCVKIYFIEFVWYFDFLFLEGIYVWYEVGVVKALEMFYICGMDYDYYFKFGFVLDFSCQMMQCYFVGMGLAVDFQFFNVLGLEMVVENFMLGVFNNVGINYDDEFFNQIEFVVNGIFILICLGCDFWIGLNDVFIVFSSFINWANGGGFGFNYSLVMFWIDCNFNGFIIGVVWFGGFCILNCYNICECFFFNVVLLWVL